MMLEALFTHFILRAGNVYKVLLPIKYRGGRNVCGKKPHNIF